MVYPNCYWCVLNLMKGIKLKKNILDSIWFGLLNQFIHHTGFSHPAKSYRIVKQTFLLAVIPA